MRKVSAIVPAAGLASRFGGPNKLLQTWNTGTVVGAVVETLLGCGIDVVVVTGRDAELVSDAVCPARSVFNSRYQDGLGTSLACGVANAPTSDGYLIALGDMPNLRAEVVSAILERYELESTDAIIAPAYAEDPERIGHPVLFGSAYRSSLLALEGDHGARSIIDSARGKLVQISVGGSLPDFDSPE
jgi:molybdenum cofactor cytidylyltransferase